MIRRTEKNRSLLNNFILYLTHCDNSENEIDWQSKIVLTPKLFYDAVNSYIEEDHVDGLGSSEEYCINLWLEAEELNRVGDEEGCFEKKDKFQEEFKQLSIGERNYVTNYLESVGV